MRVRKTRLFRTLGLAVALLLAAGAVVGLLALIRKRSYSLVAGPGDWPMEGRNPAHQSFLEKGPQGEFKEAWNVRVPQPVQAPPAVVGGRLYAGSRDGFLYCLDAENGTVEWEFDSGSEITSTPCVSGGRVFFGNGRGSVFALDQWGKEKWSRGFGDAVTAALTASGDRLYVGSRDHVLYCLQSETGRTLWSFDAGEGIDLSPCVGDGHVYCLSMDYMIHALKEETGELDWQSNLHNLFSSPPMVDKSPDGSRVFVTTRTAFYCLDTQTGKEFWKKELQESRYLSNPGLRGNQVLITQGNAKDGNATIKSFNQLTSDPVRSLGMGFAEATRLIATRDGVYSVDSESIHFMPFSYEAQAVKRDLRGVLPQTLTVTSDAVFVATESSKMYCFR